MAGPYDAGEVSNLAEAVAMLKAADVQLLMAGARLIRVAQFCDRAIQTAESFGLTDGETYRMLELNRDQVVSAAALATGLGADVQRVVARIERQQ